jgi:hypothetical protein
MRSVNALIAVVMLFAALWLAPRGIARSIAVATLIAYVPIGLYIIPSTNPSSWALTGVVAFWTFGMSLMARSESCERWRTSALATGAVIGALMAVASRLDSSVYLTVVVAVIFLAVGIGQARRRWLSALLLLALALMGLVSYVTTNPPVSPGGEALGDSEPGIGLLLTNSVNVLVYLQEAVGGPLGWYDIFMPTWVPIIGTLAIGFVIYRQLSFGLSRILLASAFGFVAFLLIPVAFLQLAGLDVGELIQPRYLLPVLVVFIATATLSPEDSHDGAWPRPVLLALMPALAVSALLAFWYTTHRYAAGSGQGLFDLDLVIEWAGLTGVPWLLVVLTTVTATVAFFATGYAILRDPEVVTEARSEVDEVPA